MEKLVRVIKLRPGEAVVIWAEEKPAPCPCCCACMMQNDTCEDAPFFDGILVCLDEAA